MIIMVIGAVVLAVVVTFLLWLNIASTVCIGLGSHEREKNANRK